MLAQAEQTSAQDIWRALGNPVRRDLLDQLVDGARTTSELVEATPGLSRFAVMQHLGVLTDAGLVLVRRRGKFRLNHLNPVPLREWYERWVTPLMGETAEQLLALRRHVEEGQQMDGLRTVRIETELKLRSTPERVFRALTEESLSWFPHTYGEEKVRAVVVEPHVGGRHFEDWGEGRGHLYGHVLVYDPPWRLEIRGRVMLGSILDSDHRIEEVEDGVMLRVTKVAVGPMTEEEAASIRQYGDISMFADALRAHVEAD
jgi:DNA-binding transcriptional ArsR family regulator